MRVTLKRLIAAGLIVFILAVFLVGGGIYLASGSIIRFGKGLIGKSIPSTEIFGTYIADNQFAIEKLTLNPNGEFVQEVTLKSTSRKDMAKGRWSYDPADGYIRFEDGFMTVVDGFGHLDKNYMHPKYGNATLPLERRGAFTIGQDPSEVYVKH